MGMIEIRTYGSFPIHVESFGPADCGHVDTVADALEWVASVLLPEAHVLDHELHDGGDVPPSGWDRKEKVGS